MHRRKRIEWWIYATVAFILLFFVAPALISASDTLLVIMGVVLLVCFSVWSWHLWIAALLNRVLENIR